MASSSPYSFNYFRNDRAFPRPSLGKLSPKREKYANRKNKTRESSNTNQARDGAHTTKENPCTQTREKHGDNQDLTEKSFSR